MSKIVKLLNNLKDNLVKAEETLTEALAICEDMKQCNNEMKELCEQLKVKASEINRSGKHNE